MISVFDAVGISKEELLAELNKLPDFSSIKFTIINKDGNTQMLNLARCDNRFILELKSDDKINIGYVLTLCK